MKISSIRIRRLVFTAILTLVVFGQPFGAWRVCGIYPSLANDDADEDCPKDEGKLWKKCPLCYDDDDCPPGNNEANDAGCTHCGTSSDHSGFAMPVWRVSEPNINLWILDIPLFYTTSHDD